MLTTYFRRHLFSASPEFTLGSTGEAQERKIRRARTSPAVRRLAPASRHLHPPDNWAEDCTGQSGSYDIGALLAAWASLPRHRPRRGASLPAGLVYLSRAMPPCGGVSETVPCMGRGAPSKDFWRRQTYSVPRGTHPAPHLSSQYPPPAPVGDSTPTTSKFRGFILSSELVYDRGHAAGLMAQSARPRSRCCTR
jgi:hypothetical protein